MPAIRALADALCDALVAFDPACWSVTDCADLAERLARTAKACETASARAAARGAPRELAKLRGRTAGAARAALETVEKVASCPATEAALCAGEVSLAQAAEIVSMPEHETELLELARTSALGPVRDLARKRRVAAIDPDELYAKQRTARTFKHWRDELGMVWFQGALTPEVGVPFVNRLDAETDRLWRAARREGVNVSRDVLAADAFARLIDGKGAGKAKSADVVFVVDINAYRRGYTRPGEPCHIVGGGPIPVGVVREMTKDGFLKTVLHDGVNIHTVAHHGRHIPAVLRTALELGPIPDLDGVTCTTNGCDRRHGLQWDHDHPKAEGGPISFANVQPLCTPCHIEKTERDRRRTRQERGP